MYSPFKVIKRRYVTEKTATIAGLKDRVGKKAVSRCENPKVTFIVDADAKKPEIADAIEEIYADKNVKVVAVNTILVKPKHRNRRGKMNPGKVSRYKKAIVTLAVGNEID